MTAQPRRRIVLCTACLILAILPACSPKTAEEKGLKVATDKIDFATGVGNGLEAKGEQAGESVVGGVGTVVHGIEKGVMKSGRLIVADPTLQAAGLQVSTIQDSAGQKDGHNLDAYVIGNASASGILAVRAFDVLGREIGRTSLHIERGVDEAKYETVAFDTQVKLSLIRKVGFTFKAAAPGVPLPSDVR